MRKDETREQESFTEIIWIGLFSQTAIVLSFEIDIAKF